MISYSRTFQLIFTVFIFFAPLKSFSQVKMAPAPRAVKAKFENMHTRVVQPESDLFEAFMTTPSATINVTYVGFGSFPDAQAAFQFAVDIWAGQVASDVPIEVIATFEPLSSNVLGSAGPNYIVRDFTGAPLSNTFYPAALANSLAGFDLFSGPGDHDINASFNSDFSNWYFGTDGNTPAGEFDFVSVVLHELGHGLGFTGSGSVNGSVGSIGDPPRIYDLFVENGAGTSIQDFTNPSVALGNQLQSDDLFMAGTNVVAANGGNRPKLYAPNPFESGSSFSHWDEDDFPAGDPNSLMTPAIGMAEAIQDPGDLTRALFEDLGWSLGSQTGVPLQITIMNSTVLIDFDNTLENVNNGQFNGSGFDPGASSGQLDSDSWSLLGMSDGDLNFGESGTTGDYARGVGSAAVSTGGVYAFESSASNRSLGVQPTNGDFTPGDIILKIQNSSGMSLTSLELSYLVYVFNDQARSNDFNFSYSTDNSSYTSIPALDVTSPQSADAMPVWNSNSRSTLIDFTGSPISSGGFLYLKWSGADVSGGGVRDQFALDDIGILPNPCFNPTSLQASGVTSSSANLDWSQILSAVSYQIQYRVVGTRTWTVTTSSTNSLFVSSLESGTEYQWKVKAICSSDGSIKSSFSAKSKFSTIGAPACPVPSSLFTAQVNDTEQNLMWDPVTEADSYEVRHRIMGASGAWTNTPSSSNSLNLTSLQPGTTYQWRVRSICAVDGSLGSPYTSINLFTTSGPAACSVPANPTATPVTETSEDLNWTMVPGAVTYEVRYKVKGAPAWIIISTASNSLSLTGLSTGTRYSWKVNAVCSVDGSVVSQGATTQTFITNGSPACATPTALLTSSITDNSADISWGTVSGAVDYRVRYRIVGSSWITSTTGGPTSTSLSALNPSTTYQWRVQAICASDGSLISPYSPKSSFTTDVPSALIGARISEDLEFTLDDAVKIYSYRDKIYIRFRDMDAAQSIIHIYGIDGRMSQEMDNRQSPQLDLELKPFLNGTSSVQIVRVLLPEGVVTKRVMVSR